MNIKTFGFIIVFLISSGNISGQDGQKIFVNNMYENVPEANNILADNPHRTIIDLNGEWQVRFGDDSTWKPVRVPSSVDYYGVIHYRKAFTLPDEVENYHLKLNALGINHISSFKLNGVFIGSHSAGYTSFSLDILETALRPGEENLLEIDVDGSLSYDSPVLPRPTPWNWKSYTGIFREIFILMMPKISVTNWYLDYTLTEDFRNTEAVFKFLFQNYNQAVAERNSDDSRQLRVEDIQEIGYYVEIFNKKTGSLVKSTASEPRFLNVYHAVEDTLKLNFRNADLWSPEDPVIYTLRVTLIKRGSRIIDRIDRDFGFRYLDLRQNGFFLNGVQRELNGIYRLEQHPDYGISIPWEVQKSDLLMIKNMGFNAVRTGPYPNHPYLYDLCDEVGILVFEEIPVNQIPARSINRPDVIDQAKLFVQEMIERDRFHPSIIAWGIGSELNGNHSNTADYIRTINDFVKQFDSRPVYYSTELIENDISLQYSDFKLIDTFNPDLTELTNKFLRIDKNRYNKPVLLGRIGTDVIPDNVGGYLNPTSLSHQAKYSIDLYEIVQNQEEIPGIFFWSFADWQGDTPILASGTEYNNRMYHRGFFTDKRVERPSHQYLKAAITNSQVPPLSMGEAPLESQRSIIFTGFGIIVMLLVFLKQDRWFGKNFRRSLLYSKIFFQDVSDRRNMNLWQTILLGFVICSSISIGLSGFFFYFKRSIYFDLIISQFFQGTLSKQILVYLAWHPVINIFATTVFLLIITYVFSLVYGLYLSLTGQTRGFSLSFNILVWSASHIVFLIPFSMALFSLIQHQITYYFFFILGLVLFIIYVSRLVLALRVTSGINYKKNLTGLCIISLVFILGTLLYYENSYKSLTYIDHYLTIVKSQIH